MMSAAVAGPTKIRPTPTYTTLRDVTYRGGWIERRPGNLESQQTLGDLAR